MRESKVWTETARGRRLDGRIEKVGHLQCRPLSKRKLRGNFVSNGAIESYRKHPEKGTTVLATWDPLGSASAGAEQIGAHCISFLGMKPESRLENVYPSADFPLVRATRVPGRAIVRKIQGRDRAAKETLGGSASGSGDGSAMPERANVKRAKLSTTTEAHPRKAAVARSEWKKIKSEFVPLRTSTRARTSLGEERKETVARRGTNRRRTPSDD